MIAPPDARRSGWLLGLALGGLHDVFSGTGAGARPIAQPCGRGMADVSRVLTLGLPSSRGTLTIHTRRCGAPSGNSSSLGVPRRRRHGVTRMGGTGIRQRPPLSGRWSRAVPAADSSAE